MSDRQVVVVGAGPGGLSSAAELGRRGVSAVVLERNGAVASSWRGRYDRLRLNSSRWFSNLPGARHPRGTGLFPSRDEMVGYLEDYARDHQIDVRFDTQVDRIERDGAGWVVRTSGGDVAAEQVVVAGGYDHTPNIPDWPGRERFRGRVLHAAQYRNPEAFRDADVLVVGPGCSGVEIAYDLAEGGARRVRLAVRTQPNIIVRAPLGVLFARALMKLPTQRADRIIGFISRKEVGDLSAYGLTPPEEGVFSRLERLGVAPAIVDKEMIEAIKDGRIEIVAGVEALDETAVELAGGARIEPDALVAATGFRRGLEPMVGHLGVLNERGVPAVRHGDAALPGLRFIGYDARPGQLGYMGTEAKRAAKAIAMELSGARAPSSAHSIQREMTPTT